MPTVKKAPPPKIALDVLEIDKMLMDEFGTKAPKQALESATH